MPGTMHVHNPEVYVECMQSGDWSEPAKKAAMTGHGASRYRKEGKKADKQREAFLEKQSLREQQFRVKLEVARQATERKQRERTEQREKDFETRLQDFVSTNQSLVQEVDGAVRADEAWRIRKRERLFNEWTLKVFQPMQDEINRKITSMTADEIEQKRRYMFQCFLDESNRKTNGLFRDIIIESDYDPMAHGRQATLTYARASVTEDPTKNRATREAGDSLVKDLLPAPREVGERRIFVPVEMWDHMEATPFGRYASEEDQPDRRPTKPNFLKSNVTFDHYNIETGADVVMGESSMGKPVREGQTVVRAEPRANTSTGVAECLSPVRLPVRENKRVRAEPRANKSTGVADCLSPPRLPSVRKTC